MDVEWNRRVMDVEWERRNRRMCRDSLVGKEEGKVMDVEKAFKHGQEAGFDALEALGKKYDGKNEEAMPSVYAGLLTTIMHCMYAHAPSEEAVDEIISWARKTAEKDWHEEQVKGEE
jgi:hypothetical protein